MNPHNARIEHHPVLGTLPPRKTIRFRFDETIYEAKEGETIAAALLANGVRTLRLQEEKGTPRGFYCNIGHCFECRVTVNGKQGIRACLTLVDDMMEVISGKPFSSPLKKGGNHA
ncbi:(2Fe-2S)-binding protein [Brevibacillus fluminis]|uniref:(2Fe-2S)-binding protein n=1 Tax=Brevibacillus fluminis TaxID=511487 RepID=UPI003F8ADBF5